MFLAGISAPLDRPKISYITAETLTRRNCISYFYQYRNQFYAQGLQSGFLINPLGDIGVTHALHLYLIGEQMIDFL